MGGKKKNIIYSAYHEYGKRLERLEKDTKLTVNNLNTTCEICNTKKNNEGLYLEFLNENIDYTNSKIINIQLNGNDVELNLTDREIKEILSYCD